MTKYSVKTGTISIAATVSRIAAINPKNFIGLQILYNLKIVPITFIPSEYVSSFDTLPSGLSRYSMI